MAINWQVVATIAAPIIALFAGVWITRRFESRPVLISYFSHVSAFQLNPAGAPPIHINTHSVVLRNAGRQAATNVRLHHTNLPDFNIWPNVVHNVDAVNRDIVIPILIPGEQITISYLYFAPMTVAQVNDGIKCDQGFAQPIPVLLQRQFPKWFNFILGALMIAGLVAILYLAYAGVSKALH